MMTPSNFSDISLLKKNWTIADINGKKRLKTFDRSAQYSEYRIMTADKILLISQRRKLIKCDETKTVIYVYLF